MDIGIITTPLEGGVVVETDFLGISEVLHRELASL